MARFLQSYRNAIHEGKKVRMQPDMLNLASMLISYCLRSRGIGTLSSSPA